jgi:predicted alpha/beta-hydrolase family hydrolase
MAVAKSVQIELSSDSRVSGWLQIPDDALAVYVLAHGAGAGMAHPFMNEVADGLARRGIASLRYQFPYMEQGGRRPDRPAVAQATVRAAVATALTLTGLPLFAGGKSFGGRMTSQAEAAGPLGVLGLAFLGFPLHLPDKPAVSRAEHLAEVRVPMLFIQGERDKLADPELIRSVTARLAPLATLQPIAHADHGFDVLVRSGRTHAEVMDEVLDTLADWIGQRLGCAAAR